MIRSYGAVLANPSAPSAHTIRTSGYPAATTFARAWSTRSASMSMLVTVPSPPTMCAISAALYPVPAPISSTRWPGATPSWSSMIAMIVGWEDELTGWPSASRLVTIASSRYAASTATSGTNRCRGTARSASATSGSVAPPRSRTCASIAFRNAPRSGISPSCPAWLSTVAARSAGPVGPAVPSAMPMLGRTWTSRLSSRNGRLSASRIRRATATVPTPSTSTANSSPPSRAAMSPDRRLRLSRAPTSAQLPGSRGLGGYLRPRLPGSCADL
jgi:hypothetical protein